MTYEFIRLDIDSLILIKPKVFYDDRGFFMETYTKNEFYEHGIKEEFVQDNQSRSIKNAIRGLHFQFPPHSQAKLVRCIAGTIMDVVVDLREEKHSFGKHVKVMLSADNKHMLYIPEGFAHGFLVLSDYAEIMYKVTRFYNKESDSGIIWNDPDLGIDWGVKTPILSDKDRSWPKLADIKSKLR
ncbi:MAG: dTDP-4-dehydrorhamnose 3,5-epimerase [Candidatus Thermoplasmatota archaeon]|nr:dTDP-4-dehydrorhamnose 3,5-epimerase [Candidatus Thermoplasmatota archaeon]MCL5963229.1 dTDP-4-dehydrorhamnose 3,5-epimerase [Candidatus Thermoplasmatota archaeon]